jgi:hypothetical protein
MMLLAGCATGPPLRTATAEQLTQLLQERAEAVQTMKALFRAQIKGPGIPIAQRVEAALYYRRPDGLRIRGFNQVGSELFNFVLDGGVYMLAMSGDPRPLTGSMAELNGIGQDDVRRPFRLSLLAASGAIGIAPVAKEEETRLSEEGDRYRLDILSPTAGIADGKQVSRRLWFDRRTLQVVQEERLTFDGALDAIMECEDFRYIGKDPQEGFLPEPGSPAAVWVRPFKIKVEDGSGRGSLVLAFHEMIPNPQLTPSELGRLVQ